MADSDALIKLTFKDLKQQKFQIDAKPSNTIAEIKEMIANEKGWDVSTQKLIYSGKILQDKNTVESYKIEEKGFVVCMVSKPKTAAGGTSTPGSSSSAAPAPSTPVRSPSTPAQAPAAPVQAPAAPAAVAPSTAAATVPETPTPTGQAGAAGAQTAFNDPSALAMGAPRDAAVQQMVEMGFEKPQVERAMRAAFNNPDRAVEYLMTGIPEHLREATGSQSRPAASRPQAQPAGEAAPATTGAGAAASAGDPSSDEVNLFEAAAARAAHSSRGGSGGAAAAGAGAGAGAEGATTSLDFLRNNPQFQQLRQVIQQQPQMLEPILQQVGSGNPQLAQLINSNPDAFLRLLAESEEGDDDGMGGGLPPGAHEIQVTAAERDAIERLCALGFSRELAAQAYFACDKNEELAANFLFEQPDDDQD